MMEKITHNGIVGIFTPLDEYNKQQEERIKSDKLIEDHLDKLMSEMEEII